MLNLASGLLGVAVPVHVKARTSGQEHALLQTVQGKLSNVPICPNKCGNAYCLTFYPVFVRGLENDKVQALKILIK